jgi:hypothetical protein
MHLTCERVREVLWPLDRPRSHVPEEEAARAHLTRCAGCRTFFLRDAEIARILRRIGQRAEVAAAPGLRLSVARALDATHRSGIGDRAEPALINMPRVDRRVRLRGRRAELAAAVAASLLLLGGQALASRFGGGPDTGRFAADFVRTAAVGYDPPGLDVQRIGGFYQKELGRQIVAVALFQAPVTRATVCDLQGELGSMVEYDLGGTRLVHYRIPRDPDGTAPLRPEVAVASKRGVQVAHWADEQFEHALVSKVAGEYLVWLAENRFNRPPEVTNYGSPASRSWRPLAAGD